MGNSGSEPAGPGPAAAEAEAGPSQGQAPPGTPGEEPRRAPPAAPGPPTPAEELHGETRRHCGSAALHETPTPRAILRRESGQAFGRRVKRCIAGRFIPSGAEPGPAPPHPRPAPRRRSGWGRGSPGPPRTASSPGSRSSRAAPCPPRPAAALVMTS